jgi:hypothetical protein
MARYVRHGTQNRFPGFLCRVSPVFGSHSVSAESRKYRAAGVALTILFTGFTRLRNPEKEEGKPTKYGPLAYGMTGLSLAITAIFLGELFVV